MTFFLLQSLPDEPLITTQPLTAAWAADATAIPAEVPVRYSVRSGGCSGEVAGDAANGILVSRRVANELERIAGDAVHTVAAVVEGLPEACSRREYVLLRVRQVISLSDVATVAVPVFAVRFDVDHIVIDARVRQRLESIGVASEHFAEMLFA